MTSHRAPRRRRSRSLRRWISSTRTRAVLSLGIVACLGVTGTFAYWTDSATISTGSFTSGTMDMRFDTSEAVGLNADYDASGTLKWSNFVPGQSAAFRLVVNNSGDSAFRYAATLKHLTGTNWTYADDPITVQAYIGGITGTPGAAGSSCSGTAINPSPIVVTTTAKDMIASPGRLLAAGGNETLCLQIGLSASAVNTDQGKSGTLTFSFSAQQAS